MDVSLPASSSITAGGPEQVTVTQYNQQGFPTVVVEPAGWSTASKSYDVHGFLITPSAIAPTPTTSAGPAGAGAVAADISPSSSVKVIKASGAANNNNIIRGLGMACGLFGGAFVFF